MANDPGAFHTPDRTGELTYDELLGIDPVVIEKEVFSTGYHKDFKDVRVIHVSQLRWETSINDDIDFEPSHRRKKPRGA